MQKLRRSSSKTMPINNLQTLPLNIGHRGAKAVLPENSMEGFRYAKEFADGFELDTQLCATGEPVVLHDSTLDRTTNHKGKILNIKSSELETILLTNRERLPLLIEVISDFHKSTLINVEIKKESTVELTKKSAKNIAGILNLYPGNIVVSSFSPLAIYYFHKYSKKIATAQLIADLKQTGRKKLLNSLFFASANGSSTVVWEKSIALNDFPRNQKTKQLGYKIWVYTSNSEDEWKTLTEQKIDAIITDDPKKLKTFLTTVKV
ncbi:glycerophosphodiester phosphodiesterase [Leptospira sp. GIMC2001]|uniref:glycerophosphodiester phosphodiesterase n=1 Tax=Leptospira sp. GIMC2001 TaxID=1513297 RepID=UPI002349C63B|nr:glycerophosphodiester phosphodiesterase [Leptospira sp. GIMC2001]WCL48130.1 glycerophosphodiester phosphodiesterase [Leptospira sp. GIMC2001]